MTFPLLYIRCKQLRKELKGLGLYLAILIGIACYLIIISFKQFEKTPNAYYIAASMALLCIGLLIILFCIPFFRLTFRQKTMFKNLSSIIHVSNFEWLSGFRKQYIAFMSLYTLAIAFCWFRILPLFLLWLLTVLISSFYSECESIMVLRENCKSGGRFLTGKLKISVKYIIVLYAPLLIINTIFNSEFLLINIMFLLIQISLLCFAICLKYGSYEPNKTQIENNILLTIVSLSAAVPYLLPVPAILTIVYFYKSQNNLKQYLDD